MSHATSDVALFMLIPEKLMLFSRRDPYDAHDIIFILISYWEAIDINRIVEQDMDSFVQQFPDTKGAWRAIKRRYGP